jgi:hypothetical protein
MDFDTEKYMVEYFIQRSKAGQGQPCYAALQSNTLCLRR